MGVDLDSFRHYLLMQGVLWDEGDTAPSPAALARKFYGCYVIDVRETLLSEREIYIPTVGGLCITNGEVKLSVSETLWEDFLDTKLRLQDYLSYIPDYQARRKPKSLIAFLNDLFAGRLKQDKLLKTMRRSAEEREEDPFEPISNSLGYVIHDLLCEGHVVKLESLGEFIPSTKERKVEFRKDEYFSQCLTLLRTSPKGAARRGQRWPEQAFPDIETEKRGDYQWSGLLPEEEDFDKGVRGPSRGKQPR